MADGKLEAMEKRVEELERRIFGDTDKDISYPKDSEEIIDTLAGLNQHLQQSVAGRKRIENVMKKMTHLEKFLDPSYTDQLTLSSEAKTEIILAEEDLIRKQAANFEKLKDMAEVLSSEHIKNVPNMEGKLAELSKLHIQQQDSAGEVSEETKDLLFKYNSIIDLLSKQFVQWDDAMSQLEASSQIKPQED